MTDAVSRRLVLLRHAKAASPTEGTPDASRPLTDRGHVQALASAHWLAAAGLASVDLVLLSPAVRTQQTWQEVAATVIAGTVATREELYGTGPQGLVALLAEVSADTASVLVVGHEPVMSGTAAALAASSDPLRPRVAAGVTTATAIVLAVPAWSDLAAGTCRIEGVGPG